jgi:hypothetical protein
MGTRHADPNPTLSHALVAHWAGDWLSPGQEHREVLGHGGGFLSCRAEHGAAAAGIVNDANALVRRELALATCEVRDDLRKAKTAMLSLGIRMR